MSYDVIHCLVQTGEVDGDGSPVGNVLPAEDTWTDAVYYTACRGSMDRCSVLYCLQRECSYTWTDAVYYTACRGSVHIHVFYVCLYCVAIVADGPMRVRVGTIKDL